MKVDEIVVFSYNDDVIKNIEELYLNDIVIHSCLVSVDYHYVPTFSNKYNVEYENYSYTPFEIVEMIGNYEEVVCYMQNIDNLIVCGGGYLNHYWSANHRKSKLLSILGTILIANRLKKRIVFMGQTYGPFKESSEMFSDFFCSLKNASFAARDSLNSISEMKKIGVTSYIATIPDDLYFLEEDLTDEREALITSPYIVLELFASMDEIESNIEQIRLFVEEMNVLYGYKVVLLPLDANYGGEIQADYIKRRIPGIDCFQIGQIAKIEDVNNIIRNADFVICQRYHLLLTAVANRTCVVQILKMIQGDYRYYYCKAKGLLEQVFNGMYYEDTLFLQRDIWKCLKILPKNLSLIRSKQNSLYNSIVQNEIIMRKERNEYLNTSNIFKGD